MKKERNNKQGITMLVLMIAIAVMAIIISTAVVVGNSAIKTANYDEYISTLNKVSNDVNAYYLKNEMLPITGDIVSAESLGSDFFNSYKANNDVGNDLYVIDVSLLEDSTIDNGMGNVKNKDVYLVAENTHNIYYVKGFKYKSENVYCIK